MGFNYSVDISSTANGSHGDYSNHSVMTIGQLTKKWKNR